MALLNPYMVKIDCEYHLNPPSVSASVSAPDIATGVSNQSSSLSRDPMIIEFVFLLRIAITVISEQHSGQCLMSPPSHMAPV